MNIFQSTKVRNNTKLHQSECFKQIIDLIPNYLVQFTLVKTSCTNNLARYTQAVPLAKL